MNEEERIERIWWNYHRATVRQQALIALAAVGIILGMHLYFG